MENTNESIFLLVRYFVKDNCRDSFFNEIKQNEIDKKSLSENGCMQYEFCFAESKNELILLEKWENTKSQKEHLESKHYAVLKDLKAKYVLDTKITKYSDFE